MMQETPSGRSNYGRGEKIAIPKLKRGPPPPCKGSENNRKDRVQVFVLYIGHGTNRFLLEQEHARPAASRVRCRSLCS